MIHYVAAAAFCMCQPILYMYARSLGRCPATYTAVWLVVYDGNAEYRLLLLMYRARLKRSATESFLFV